MQPVYVRGWRRHEGCIAAKWFTLTSPTKPLVTDGLLSDHFWHAVFNHAFLPASPCLPQSAQLDKHSQTYKRGTSEANGTKSSNEIEHQANKCQALIS